MFWLRMEELPSLRRLLHIHRRCPKIDKTAVHVKNPALNVLFNNARTCAPRDAERVGADGPLSPHRSFD